MTQKVDDLSIEASSFKREPYVYRCSRHNYVLETTAPKIGATLKIFCPLCKDEWFAQHLTELQNENPNAGKLVSNKGGAGSRDQQKRIEAPEHHARPPDDVRDENVGTTTHSQIFAEAHTGGTAP